MVYSSLLMALMGGIWLLLQAGLRYYRTGEVHQRVAQEAAIAMRKMCLELSNSTPPSVHLDSVAALPPQYPSTVAITFLSADQPYPGSGNWTYDSGMANLQYKKWVCFFLDTTNGRLTRTEEAGTPGLPCVLPTSTVPAAPGLAAMQALTAPRRSVLARNISNLSFQLDPPNRIIVDVSASQETGSLDRDADGKVDQVTTVNLHSRVFSEN